MILPQVYELPYSPIWNTTVASIAAIAAEIHKAVVLYPKGRCGSLRPSGHFHSDHTAVLLVGRFLQTCWQNGRWHILQRRPGPTLGSLF